MSSSVSQTRSLTVTVKEDSEETSQLEQLTWDQTM